MVKLLLGIFLILLAGCDVRYRYPCQNPDNWEKDYCKKPYCEVSRDCPEYIFKGQEAGFASFGNSGSNCAQCNQGVKK